MDTLSPRPKIVSIYNCPACKEVIYKVVRKGSKLRPGYWCHIYCPHCSVRLSPNQAVPSGNRPPCGSQIRKGHGAIRTFSIVRTFAI